MTCGGGVMGPYRTPGVPGQEPTVEKVVNTITAVETYRPSREDRGAMILREFARSYPDMKFTSFESLSYGILPRLLIRYGDDSEQVAIDACNNVERACDVVHAACAALIDRAKWRSAPPFAGKLRKWGR